MKNYTSPSTGKVYEIVTQNLTRMGGNWHSGEPLREVTYTQYDICLDGRMVQFTFRPDGIAEAVARYENPGPDLGSRWD
jgi:hypothetical protein